jgi:hypothetical protein
MMLATIFAPAAVFCQEEDPEYQMEISEMKMELERRDAEMDFQRSMQELELEERRIEVDRLREGHEHRPCKKGPFLLLVIIVHILVAVWVYQDIRKRNTGSGIWIVIALLAGLLGVLVYAVVRIGDRDKKEA